MDAERLAEIKALTEGATPGPWVADEDGTVLQSKLYPIVICNATFKDADLIAQARTIIPELVAEVERLQGELGEARKVQDAVCPKCDGMFLTGVASK